MYLDYAVIVWFDIHFISFLYQISFIKMFIPKYSKSEAVLKKLKFSDFIYKRINGCKIDLPPRGTPCTVSCMEK